MTSLISKLNVVLDNNRIDVHPLMIAENVRINLEIFCKIVSDPEIQRESKQSNSRIKS